MVLLSRPFDIEKREKQEFGGKGLVLESRGQSLGRQFVMGMRNRISFFLQTSPVI